MIMSTENQGQLDCNVSQEKEVKMHILQWGKTAPQHIDVYMRILKNFFSEKNTKKG